jgi:DHA2 family multidrug resistance protein
MLMQYAPLGFIFVPAITASYFGVPLDRSDSVSGLTNFTRNIGSSVGASIVTTILARRQQFHLARLSEHMNPTSPSLAMSFQALAAYAHRIGASNLQAQALGLGMIYRSLMAQAAALSYLDVYIALGTGGIAMFFLSFLLKSNNPTHTETATGH